MDQPPPAPRNALSHHLRAIDWIALMAIALTVVSAVATNVLANLAHSGGATRVDVLPQSLEFLPDSVLALIGLGGLIVGIGALASGTDSPKWPGGLALLCPLIAVVADLMALGTQLQGMS